jgi:hypothetical protein
VISPHASKLSREATQPSPRHHHYQDAPGGQIYAEVSSNVDVKCNMVTNLWPGCRLVRQEAIAAQETGVPRETSHRPQSICYKYSIKCLSQIDTSSLSCNSESFSTVTLPNKHARIQCQPGWQKLLSLRSPWTKPKVRISLLDKRFFRPGAELFKWCFG